MPDSEPFHMTDGPPVRLHRAEQLLPVGSSLTEITNRHLRLVGEYWILGHGRSGRFSGRRGRPPVRAVR